MRRLLALALLAAAATAASTAGATHVVSFEEKLVVAPDASLADAPQAPGKQGRLYVVGGGNPRTGKGPVRRYLVEVEGGIRIGRRAFAERVHTILGSRRGWGGTGRVSFRRVSSGPVRFRVTLARPATTDRLCLPYVTGGIYSCAVNGRAVLNLMRWRKGAAAYGRDVDRYRRYLVNHEVGHLLGHGHRSCPAAGARAPVMMQQTKGVGACRANPWPLPYERR